MPTVDRSCLVPAVQKTTTARIGSPDPMPSDGITRAASSGLQSAEYTISRVIKGGWQLAGGHGTVDREQALRDMLLYVDN